MLLVKVGSTVQCVQKQDVLDLISKFKGCGTLDKEGYEKLHDSAITTTSLTRQDCVAIAAAYAYVFNVDISQSNVKWVIITTSTNGRLACHGGEQADIDAMKKILDTISEAKNKS
ncbi:hypothetical protein ACRFW0_000136 [Vibrio cholerae]